MQYVVAYARITTEKDNISLQGVYFGGVGETPEQADEIARECVNQIRGGSILPKVMLIEEKEQLISAMLDVCEKFEQVTAYMVEANGILTRTNRKK